MTELENDHHGYDWFNWDASAMINEWVKSQRRNRIVYKVTEYLPTKYLLQRIKKKLYSEKNYRLYLNQTNLISPVMGQIDIKYHLK